MFLKIFVKTIKVKKCINSRLTIKNKTFVKTITKRAYVLLKMKRRTEESEEQITFVKWCKRKTREVPELWGLFAIPNGGHRHIKVAMDLKLEGVKPGVPDLFLPVARHTKHGLFIEMKRKKGGTLSPHQEEWFMFLKSQNYACVRCDGFEEAKKIICKYLSIKD